MEASNENSQTVPPRRCRDAVVRHENSEYARPRGDDAGASGNAAPGDDVDRSGGFVAPEEDVGGGGSRLRFELVVSMAVSDGRRGGGTGGLLLLLVIAPLVVAA